MAGIVLVNRAVLNGDEGDELRRLFAPHDVVECEPDEASARARAAVAADVDFVAVVGGDGTIRSVAQELCDERVALLPVPGGTRNHFAKDLGINSFDDAAAAINGRRRKIDVGDVNGRCFVNNSSIGVYPQMVRQRESRERRMPKWLANILAAWEQVRRGRRIRVDVDGETQWAWMVFIGNGCYGDDLGDLSTRAALDENVLDVRIVRADKRFSRLRIIGALLTGRLALSPVVRVSRSRHVVLDVDHVTVEVALDGEVERLETPLEYSSRAGALTVLGADDS